MLLHLRITMVPLLTLLLGASALPGQVCPEEKVVEDVFGVEIGAVEGVTATAAGVFFFLFEGSCAAYLVILTAFLGV